MDDAVTLAKFPNALVEYSLSTQTVRWTDLPAGTHREMSRDFLKTLLKSITRLENRVAAGVQPEQRFDPE